MVKVECMHTCDRCDGNRKPYKFHERERERDTHSVLIITYTFSFNSVQRFRAILTRTRTLDCSCQNMVSLIPGFDLIQILYCKPLLL